MVFTQDLGGPPSGDTTKRNPPGFVLPLPSPTASPRPQSQVIGGYEVIRELGRGGMGVVYLAESLALRRRVALKVLVAPDDPELVERFLFEARAAARLEHPNVVGVHEVGRDGNRWFLAMDLVEGESLRARIVRDGPLAPDEAARVCEGIARALHHAHARAVVHRDVKPHNVLLAADGTPLLADFGLAKDVGASGVTMTGAVMGTPAYMAPEQAAADHARIDRRADVYALGATLYEALTGRPPFTGPTALSVMRQVTEDLPVPPSKHRAVDRDLETICLTCLAKDPGARYDTAALLADDLRRWSRGEPIAARRAGRLERALKWARRHPIAVAGLALALLILTLAGAATAGAWLQRGRVAATAAAAAAEAERVALATTGDALVRLASAQDAATRAAAWRVAAPSSAEAVVAARRTALRAADLAREINDFNAARASHLLALEADPGAPDAAAIRSAVECCAHLLHGTSQMGLEDWASAEESFGAAIAARPDWPQPWTIRAELFHMSRRIARAANDVEEALRRDPRAWRALQFRADIKQRRGDLVGALADARLALDLQPTNPSVALGLVALLDGAADGAQEAEAVLTQVLAVNRRWTQGHVTRARVRFDAGDVEGGIEDLRQATRLEPDGFEPWFLLGMKLLERGDSTAAVEALDRAVELEPMRADVRLKRAFAHVTLRDPARAVADFDEAVRLEPRNLSYARDRGVFHATSGDPRAALDDLDRVLASGPDPAALQYRGQAHLRLGRFEAAERDANLVIGLSPTAPQGWLLRGTARSNLPGRAAEAAADLERFLQLAPGHPQAEFVRAEAARLRGRQ